MDFNSYQEKKMIGLESNTSKTLFLGCASVAVTAGGAFIVNTEVPALFTVAAHINPAIIGGVVLAIFGMGGFIGACTVWGRNVENEADRITIC
jgi:ABC-type molybdate transport system permease subunit